MEQSLHYASKKVTKTLSPFLKVPKKLDRQVMNKCFTYKLHTCEEGGAHLRIFFLAFVDELQKQIIITKTVEVGQKKQNNFNIYNVELF